MTKPNKEPEKVLRDGSTFYICSICGELWNEEHDCREPWERDFDKWFAELLPQHRGTAFQGEVYDFIKNQRSEVKSQTIKGCIDFLEKLKKNSDYENGVCTVCKGDADLCGCDNYDEGISEAITQLQTLEKEGK